MWKQKMGISLALGYPVPIKRVIEIVKTVGFDAISPEWSNLKALDEIAELANEQGLILQSLHAPYRETAKLWSKDENVSAPVLAEILSAIDGCVKHGIPLLVMHAWKGFEECPPPTKEGISNYETIVKKAKAHGVKIALENTEGKELLDVLMNHFRNEETVGFCWDSGHEMCFNRSKDLLSEYGDRLFITHLNDNLGISDYGGKVVWTDDLHLLPLDGISDWDYNVKRLAKAKPLDVLNFELYIRNKPNRYDTLGYEKMSIEEYFCEAYRRACKIASRLIREKNVKENKF